MRSVRGSMQSLWLITVGSVLSQSTFLSSGGTCSFSRVEKVCYNGGTIQTLDETDFDRCCMHCEASASCTHFTMNLGNAGASCRLKSGDPGSQAASDSCTSAISLPPLPPPAPPSPAPRPPDPSAPRPHIIAIFADDLGWYDTAIYNPKSPTPALANLTKEGVRLDRHYVFRYCSPTRRSFFTGRFPNQITTVQPDGSNMCSDFMPLAVDILPEKLRLAGYASHFVGKGHLGYQTMDHLPINRGFASHVGYLGGSEKYFWGSGDEDPLKGQHDMWHDLLPGIDVVPDIYYSANFYAKRAVDIIEAHDPREPLFMYFAIQNVHSPYQLPPSWEVSDFPEMWDHTYANMLHMLDKAVANVTQALKRTGLWDNTLVVFTADNGGVGKFGNNHPLRGHKHDPWEGGTRAAAFMSGGFVPHEIRGTSSGDKLVHVSDWYTTFCALAGVDARNDVYIKDNWRRVDGVNVWPMLIGANNTHPRAVTPTSETGIIDTAQEGKWWKLVTLAGQSNYYAEDSTQTEGTDPCLEKWQEDPPQPGRTDKIVNGPADAEGGACAVCNSTQPCLYNLLSDPYEQYNVAADHPDVVTRLAPILDAYNDHYVDGHLHPAIIAANYTAIDQSEWQGYTGPCYRRIGSSHIQV